MTPEEQLREVCLRVTRPRVAALTEVSAHPHADVDTLTAQVRSRLGSVSTQTVHDVLRALADAELIRPDRARRLARSPRARVGDNHHHGGALLDRRRRAGSPDTWCDPRGFALKSCTSEGNFDLVGNNTPIFFIRDAMSSHTSSGARRGSPTQAWAATRCNGTSGRSTRSQPTRSHT